MALEVGMSLEVINSNNEVLFRAKVLEVDFDNESIKIVHARGDDLPPTQYNTEFKLRGYQNGNAVHYRGTVCGSTDDMWKLDHVTKRTVQERREFFRQSIAVEALVERVGTIEGSLPAKEGAVQCTLLDVSGGGVQLSCKKEFDCGDELHVVHAELVANSKPFSFYCTVRRVEEAMYSHLYGCQFSGLTPNEQERLISAIFVLQREEAKRLRGRK